MCLCNLKLVLLSNMFHWINFKRKQLVTSDECLFTLSYVRSALVDKHEGTLSSFLNEKTNWILKDLAIAIYFQYMNFCHFSKVKS